MTIFQVRGLVDGAGWIGQLDRDLTPPDFFLWGFVKDKVYSRNPQTLQQLRIFVEEAITLVSVDLCQKVCRSVPHRLRLCIGCDGQHFEHKL